MQRGGLVREHYDARDLGQDLLQQLELFWCDFAPSRRRARDVAAGPSEACDKVRPNRIADHYRDDGNRARRLLGCQRRGRSGREDHIDFEIHEFRRQRQVAFV